MQRRLTKSNSNRMFMGVIGGIGEYFGLDESIVTIIRIVWALATVMTMGSPILVYIVLAIVLPNPGASRKTYQRSSYEKPWENERKNFYRSNPNDYQTGRKIKEAEPANDEDNWSDF